MFFIKFKDNEGKTDYSHWSYFIDYGLEFLPQVHKEVIAAIERDGEYYEEENVNNYVHTHYRIYNHDGTLVIDAVCINEYGSCYGLGYGYIHRDTEGVEFNFDYFDLEV